MWGPAVLSDIGRNVLEEAKVVQQFKLFIHLVIIEGLLRAATSGKVMRTQTRQGLPGSSLEVQWLRLCTPSARGLGSILVGELDPTC